MLRHSLPAVAAVLCFLLASDSQAGGLIRRIPEVGEYAMFSYRNTPDPLQPGKLAWDGELIVKCVGIAEIDGRRHLWLEFDITHRTINPEDGQPLSPRNHISKLLVAEDTLFSHDCEIARGWERFDNNEPNEISARLASELLTSLVSLVVKMSLTEIEDQEPIEVSREITIDGEPRTLTSAVAGTSTLMTTHPVPQSTLIERTERDIASIWWLEEDLAFGVAAWESTISAIVTIEGQPRLSDTWATTMNLDLVEYGSGAVSGLPDLD